MITDEELMEQALASQIKEAPEEVETSKEQVNEVEEAPKNEAAKYLGTKLGHVPGENPFKSSYHGYFQCL